MFIKWRIFCKIIDSLNMSIISLIILLSFVSLKSQSQWTNLYSSILEIRNKNNNIIDHISKTEQYFLNEMEYRNNIKNTNPDDLIYLEKTKEKERINFISLVVNEITRGFQNGTYQRGY